MSNFNYNQARSFESVVEQLSAYLVSFPARIRMHTDDDLKKPMAPGKWSRQQICGHLVDSALNNLQRFLKIKIHDPTTPMPIIPYSQVDLVEINHYQDQAIEEILVLWEALNRQIVQVVKHYTKEELNLQVYVQTEGSVETIAWWLDDYLGHLEHHIQQMQ